jgi:hypothetical protein
MFTTICTQLGINNFIYIIWDLQVYQTILLTAFSLDKSVIHKIKSDASGKMEIVSICGLEHLKKAIFFTSIKFINKSPVYNNRNGPATHIKGVPVLHQSHLSWGSKWK